MTEMKYDEVPRRSREELAEILKGDDPEQIRSALYSAAWYEEDWRWTQNYCLTFLKHDDPLVRWAAALSLGYIALFHKHLDLDRVLPALHRAHEDPAIRSTVGDSLDLIAQNLGVDVTRRDEGL
jgi:HEAT repeat protein